MLLEVQFMANKFIIKTDMVIMKVKHKGKTLDVLLDIEDVEKVKNIGSWHAIYDKTLQVPNYYIAHRYNNKIKGNGVIKLHRLIMNCPSGKVVDHINHDTLDNRKINLKICTHFENQQNLRSRSTEQTGVYQRKRKNKWCANITKNKIRYYKEFNSKMDAIAWRKQKELELYYNEKGVMPQ